MALGVSMWCPYEGTIPQDKVLAVLARFHDAGMRRFYLAGSMGMEEPRQVGQLFAAATARFPEAEFGFHVHNLAGWGSANILAALDAGARFIEGAICGIGGGIIMPTTVGSVGNVPTEDLVALLNGMGVATGVDTDAVVAAAKDVSGLLDIVARSHAANGVTRAGIMAQAKASPRSHPV